jgi:hypothetical protein
VAEPASTWEKAASNQGGRAPHALYCIPFAPPPLTCS